MTVAETETTPGETRMDRRAEARQRAADRWELELAILLLRDRLRIVELRALYVFIPARRSPRVRIQSKTC